MCINNQRQQQQKQQQQNKHCKTRLKWPLNDHKQTGATLKELARQADALQYRNDNKK